MHVCRQMFLSYGRSRSCCCCFSLWPSLFRWRHKTKTLRALKAGHIQLQLRAQAVRRSRTRQTCVNCVNVKIDKTDDSSVLNYGGWLCWCRLLMLCSCRSFRRQRCFAAFLVFLFIDFIGRTEFDSYVFVRFFRFAYLKIWQYIFQAFRARSLSLLLFCCFSPIREKERRRKNHVNVYEFIFSSRLFGAASRYW